MRSKIGAVPLVLVGFLLASCASPRGLDEPPLQLSERARLRELERENRELRMKNDFLSKAAAYFAAEHR